jgi:glycosyltransferase involved in cell wall biosynthesis
MDGRAMNVVLLAPWFRTLAQLHGAELVKHGHDVRVVTTDAHMQASYGLVDEVVVPARLRSPAVVLGARTAWRFAGSPRPDVAVVDETWDPRFLAAARRAERVVVAVHDAVPHDDAQRKAGWQQRLMARTRRGAAEFVCFGDSVAAELAVLGRPVTQLPLTSELPDADAPQPRPAEERRDFVLLGRMHPYKNLEIVLAAWRRHVASGDYAGDRLVVWGTGAVPDIADGSVVVRRAGFDLVGAARELAAFKGSISAYRAASQSGVQVLSMQCGVASIVTRRGALVATQPPELRTRAVDPDDVGGLAAELGRLADPVTAARDGSLSRVWYDARHAQGEVGRRFSALVDRSADVRVTAS